MHEAALSLYLFLLASSSSCQIRTPLLWCGGVDHSTCACTLTLLDVLLQTFLCTPATSNKTQYYMDQQSNAQQEHQPFQVVRIKSCRIVQGQERPSRDTVPLAWWFLNTLTQSITLLKTKP